MEWLHQVGSCCLAPSWRDVTFHFLSDGLILRSSRCNPTSDIRTQKHTRKTGGDVTALPPRRSSLHHDGGVRGRRRGDLRGVQGAAGPGDRGPPRRIQTLRQTQDGPDRRQPAGTHTHNHTQPPQPPQPRPVTTPPQSRCSSPLRAETTWTQTTC